MDAFDREEEEQVLDEEEGLKFLSSIAKNLQDITELPLSTIIKLCEFYKFDKERIINEFYADPEGVLKKIGAGMKSDFIFLLSVHARWFTSPSKVASTDSHGQSLLERHHHS
jgi:hypothetical protein